MCASWYVEYDGTTTPEPAIADDDTSDTNDIGLGGNTDVHAFVSLITQLQNNLEPGNPIRINVRRKTLWEDFTEQRMRRVKLEKRLKIVFLGEPAIDDGGPLREFFSGTFS